MLYAQINEHGLNEGVLEMDAPSAAAHPLPPGWRLKPLRAGEHRALKFLGHAIRHTEAAGWHLLPEAHVRSWNRARGHDAAQVLELHERHQEHVKALGPTGALACLGGCPDDLPAPPPCVRRLEPPALEVRPDLWIRAMTDEEATQFAEQLVAAKLYEQADDHTRARVATWYDDPHCWPMVVTWLGEPIEFESYHFQVDRPSVVRVGFNVRLRRDRPYRFWREVFAPFFVHLQSVGITTIESRVRGDRPAYIQGLIDTYGAQQVSVDGGWVNLRYGIEAAIALARGFPVPVSAGPAWEWRQGDVRVWEASAEEVAALDGQLQTVWRFLPGGPTSRRILRDWTALDGATVLLGSQGEVLRYARVFRERAAGVAAWASLLPFYDEDGQAVMAKGVQAWARTVGYSKAVTFVPASIHASPTIEAQDRRAGASTRVIGVQEGGPELLHIVETDFAVEKPAMEKS
jgi:hypothetical protein